VALSDTLLRDYPAEEIETVIAHELGHYKNRDFIRLFVFQAAVLFICLWLTHIVANAVIVPLGYAGLEDVAALPLLVLILAAVNILLTPLSNSVSRSFETAADDFALRLTGNPQAFISMMTRLTEQNLGEAKPPRWAELLLDDHPSYSSRVAYAGEFVRSGRKNRE
jgi:STE24 endopeptidase